jgi:hypothetical protein
MLQTYASHNALHRISNTVILGLIILALSNAQVETQTTVFDHRDSVQRHKDTYYEKLHSRTLQERVNSPGDSAFTVLGRWAWGPCRAVELTGHYALVGQGSVYQVFDVSNPSSPQAIYDTTFDEWVKDIKIRDSLLIIAFSHKFVIYRAANLHPLVEIGRSAYIGGFPVDMTFSDSLLFVLADYGGVYAFNISDPAHPYFRAQFPLIDEDASSISSTGRYVYYGALGPGFRLSILKYRPDSGFAYKPFDVGLNAISSYLLDTLLFIGNSYGDLRIYSINDPWSPSFIDSINLGTRVLRITVKGQNVYCSTKDSGIVVLSVADSLHPVVATKGRWRSPYRDVGRKLAHSDSLLAEASYASGIVLYSIQQRDSLDDKFYYPTGGAPTDLAFKGDFGFVTCGNAGLWSVDFSNPFHPNAISNVRTLDYSYGVAITGNLACFIIIKNAYGIPDSLIVAKFDDVGALTRLSSVDVGGEARSIVARDSLVIVGTTGHVSIFSIANPMAPLRLSTLSMQGTTYVGVLGNYLYAGDAGAGEVRIINISDPGSPDQVDSLSISVFGLLARDSLVHIASDTGLTILTVSNPLAPKVIAAIRTSGSRSRARLAKEKDFVYMVYDQLHVVDISILSKPREVTSLFDYSFPEGVASKGNLVYSVSPYEGVWIVQNNLVTSTGQTAPPPGPTSFLLCPNYPNPFNAETQIEYEVVRTDHVSIKVFDMFGRCVTTLVNEKIRPGHYRVHWNASEFASGVYFYRLSAPQQTVTRKMLHLR